MQKNLMYALFLSTAFISIETIFRLENEALTNVLKIGNYIEIFAIFLLVSFVPKKLSNLFLIFLSTLFVAQILHFKYFGYFLFPMEFILFFTKSYEVFEVGLTKLDIMLEPTLYAFILALCIYALNRFFQKRKILTFTKYLFIFLLLFPIINTGLHYKKRSLGDRPNANKSIIKNTLYVSKTFFGKTLPLHLLNIQIVPDSLSEKFKVNVENKIPNVIFVIGESLSLHYMSLYGYKRNTTPHLLSWSKQEKNFFHLKAISGGLFTDTSIPMILNCAKKPNAMKSILANSTNLFRLAKENDYNTYWISTQSNDSFSYIRNYMGVKYIDHYTDSSKLGKDNFTNMFDDILYEQIQKIDFSKSNFIVLNMSGSHEPYENKVPQSFAKKFKEKSDRDNYDNSVSYSDEVLNKILHSIQTNSKKKFLFVFTSDHGQHVTLKSCGKGNLADQRDYEVPLIFYSNFNVNSQVKTVLEKNEYLSHFNMSLIIAHYLGYKTLHQMDTSRAYVNGNELSGNGGYLEYDLKTQEKIFK